MVINVYFKQMSCTFLQINFEMLAVIFGLLLLYNKRVTVSRSCSDILIKSYSYNIKACTVSTSGQKGMHLLEIILHNRKFYESWKKDPRKVKINFLYI